MTSWEPAQPKAWDKWAGWHDDAAASSGFRPPRLESEKQPEAPLPKEVRLPPVGHRASDGAGEGPTKAASRLAFITPLALCVPTRCRLAAAAAA